MYTMKKKNPFLVLFLLVVISTMACNFSGRTRTVKVNNGDGVLKIEYHGDILFSEDGTRVEEISPEGYIRYRCNNQRIYIESDEDGVLKYKVYNNGQRLNKNDADAVEFLTNAVKKMEEHYYHQ
jgi:hypothetical protein